MNLSPHFKLEEFTNSATAIALGIDNTPTEEHLQNLKEVALRMESVRALFGKPVIITSGYRNPELNAAVGGVKNSAHALGWAVDFKVLGFSLLETAAKIANSGIAFDQLIHEKNRCVHISFDPRMRRQVLRQPGGPGSRVYPGL